MQTLLLTWNPKYKGADGAAWQRWVIRRLSKARRSADEWSTGANTHVVPGSRFFLLRQGRESAGIVGSGYTASGSYKGRHWNPAKRKQGIKANYCEITWLNMLAPDFGLSRKQMIPNLLSKSFVNSQQSGRVIPPRIANRLAIAWDKHIEKVRKRKKNSDRLHVASAPQLAYADQHSKGSLKAPGRRKRTIHVYDRIRGVRLAALVRAGGRCESCRNPGIVLPDGRIFLETHHVVALSKGGKDHLTNVIALCPNEHRAAHYGANAPQLEKDFKALLRTKRRG
jgi:5-methylcytosine-specific restriction endonuclease McrA